MSAANGIRKIHDITDKEMTQLIDLCIRAYKDEPSFPAMLGGRDELRGLLFRAMIGAGALAGELYVLENARRQIVAMSLWYKPGETMWGTEDQRGLGYNELMQELDEDTKAWWKTTYGTRVGEFLKKTLPMSSIDCWWLSVLATHPEHQRHGYATRLLNHVLKQIAAPNIAGLCTTAKENEGYYNNMGFKTKGYMELPSRFGDIPVYCLTREIKTNI